MVFTVGPTNSGKTYNALQAFKAAEKGIYCGPLRLLAMEVYDSTNADGVLCNLITGAVDSTLNYCDMETNVGCSKLLSLFWGT